MSAPTIERALTLKLAESEFLDLKRDAYSEAKEWVKDVTAFANGSGGQLLIGVDEDSDGRASKAVGIAVADLDTHLQQLDSWLRDLTEPDVTPSVRISIESDDAGLNFIVVDVQESARAPHRVIVKGGMQNNVYMRKGRRNSPLSMDEIRDAVLDTHRTPKLIGAFLVNRRFDLGKANPLRTEPGRYLVLHVCPRKGFGSRRLVDWTLSDGKDRLPEDSYWSRTEPNTLGAFSAYTSQRINVDPAYHQVFYNGCAELLYTDLLYQSGEAGDQDREIFVVGPRIKTYVVANLAKMVEQMFEATGCDEYEVGTHFHHLPYRLAWEDNRFPRQSSGTPHQTEFNLPNVVIRIGPDGHARAEDLNEILHLTWRAWGQMRCPIV